MILNALSNVLMLTNYLYYNVPKNKEAGVAAPHVKNRNGVSVN